MDKFSALKNTEESSHYSYNPYKINHDFVIRENDTLDENCNKKFLHFFQHNTKFLYLINLEDLHKFYIP